MQVGSYDLDALIALGFTNDAVSSIQARPKRHGDRSRPAQCTQCGASHTLWSAAARWDEHSGARIEWQPGWSPREGCWRACRVTREMSVASQVGMQRHLLGGAAALDNADGAHAWLACQTACPIVPSFPPRIAARSHPNHRALEVMGPLLARNAAEEAEDSEAEERMHVDL